MRCFIRVCCLFVVGACLAQEGQPFTAQKEFYIHGNATVIGNNSLSKDAKAPFDKADKVNDEYKMVYVDIDDDLSTHSSSSARLLIDESVKIKYAALYWAGTYNGAQSVKKYKDKRTFYRIKQERQHDPRLIKFALPGQDYTSIEGNLIFDAVTARNRMIKSYRPYVCMADVTSYLQGLSKKSGSYTVANVSATQGYILGGSSAGWMLYIVYENEQDPLRYITSYHGLEFVNKQPVDILFSNFKTPEIGAVNSSVTLAVLEGDNTLKRDKVGVYDPEKDTFVLLDNKVRASDNFFNSSITIDDQIFDQRQPNSSNTLGFDIAQLAIPNPDNTIISNQANKLTLRLASRSDRFFVFFTAFQTNLSQDFNPQIRETKEVIVAPPTPSTPVPEEVLSQPALEQVVDSPSTEATEIAKIQNSTAVSIPTLEKGYYIVTNVFSSESNAKRWAAKLRRMSYRPEVVQRPDNGLYYVYIDKGLNVPTLYEKLAKARKNPALTTSWMLKINMD